MLTPSYLSIFYCVSSGLNEEYLGSDEADIINIGIIIIDLEHKKTVDICEYYIKSSSNSNFLLNEECKKLVSFNQDYFESSITLEEFINKFSIRLKLLDFNLEEAENKFCFIIDGPLHFRQAFIPECSKKDINLPFYYYKYFDLKKEFMIYSKCDKLFSLNEIATALSVQQNDGLSFSLKQCKLMENIIFKMIESGHTFFLPEIISKELEIGVCSIDEKIDENTIVRVRGLPWLCNDYDVNKFFSGLNIANGGVALCLTSQGKRNGEALVRFINEEQRNLALKRHKHHIGQRYIEVYRASGKDFLSIAGGSNSEAKAFLSRNGKIIIRMRGLPFDSMAKDVVEFFERGENSCKILDDEFGVLFVHYPDGRSTGDAFVMFKTEEEANKALLKHKETMGARYIELFRSTPAEVQQVFKRSQDPKFYHSNSKDAQVPPLPILPPEMISAGNVKDCIRLKNLPIECGIEQILEFLGVHSQHIVQQGVHMILNSQGQPSGEVFIQFDGEQSALNVSNHKNNKFMYFSGRKYFIEVIQCSGEEMNLVLMGALPSNVNFNQISQKTISPKLLSNPNFSNNQYINHCQTAPVQIQPNFYFPNITVNSQPMRGIQSINPIIPSIQYPTSNSYQPIIWYYPTPPVSPSSIFLHPSQIIHSLPTNQLILILKNAPLNITVNEVLQFFNGYEIIPDCIQIQNNTENGFNNSDVYITLHNRNEAERAVIEKNHHKIGKNAIELYLAM